MAFSVFRKRAEIRRKLAANWVASVLAFFNAEISFSLMLGFKRFAKADDRFQFVLPARRLDVSDQLRSDHVYVWFDTTPPTGVTISLISRSRAALVNSPFFSRAWTSALSKCAFINKQRESLPFRRLIFR